MTLCTNWCDTANKAAAPLEEQTLMQRLLQHGATAPEATDKTLSAVLTKAAQLHRLAEVDASRQLQKHIWQAQGRAQEKLVEHRREMSIHDVYIRPGNVNYRRPVKRQALFRDMEAVLCAISRFEADLDAFRNGLGEFPGEDPSFKAAHLFISLYLADLYSKLADYLHELAMNMRQANAKLKHHSRDHQLRDDHCSVEVHSNCCSINHGWGSACERAELEVQAGTRHWPLTTQQLKDMPSLFAMMPVWARGRVWELFRTI